MDRRRRAVVTIALAMVCAALAASMVSSYADRVNARVGPLVGVLVATREIPKDVTLTYGNARRFVGVRKVAQRYAPGRAFGSLEQVLGYATLVRIPSGTYLAEGQLGGGERALAPEIGKGERAVDVAVAGGGGAGSTLGPGSRVDVLVTIEGKNGTGGRSFLALEDVEVLAVGAARDTGAAAARGGVDAEVTLRVSLRQAVFLTAAQNFAKEVRVLERAAGDRGHTGAAGYAAGQLSQ